MAIEATEQTQTQEAPKSGAGAAAAGTEKQTTTEAPKTLMQDGGAAKAATTAPAEFDLKLPEGFEADTKTLDEYKALAKEFGLDGPKAQKGIEFYAKAFGSFDQRVQQAAAEQRTEWTKAAKADKEYGGLKLEASVQTAELALQKFGSPELRKLLTDSGLSSHPEVLRLLYRAGQGLKEATTAGTRTNGVQQPPLEESKTEAAKAWFPNTPSMHAGS